jgi:hypothetical protein
MIFSTIATNKIAPNIRINTLNQEIFLENISKDFFDTSWSVSIFNNTGIKIELTHDINQVKRRRK